jgi:predicted ATP-grasp superfamily ATP-dependent carboligase
MSLPQPTPAIVVGSGIGALGALRLFARAGIPTYSLNVKPAAESRSRWFRRLPGAEEGLASAPLAALLQRTSVERGVLIPCSDALVREIAELPAALAQRFPSSVSPAEVVTQLTNKARFARLLAQLDVPRPLTLVLQNSQQLLQLSGVSFEQLFLKPEDSTSFMHRYGVKGVRVRTLADARTQFERVHADQQPVVVQEYVPGPASNHYLIDGFAAAGGDIRALFARRRLRMHPADFGDSSCMVSVSLGEVEAAVATLRRILSAIGYRGIFSAEFKRDSRDGQFKILEVNARVWIYVEFAGRCGVDVCSLAYRDALGLAPEPARVPRHGVRLVSPGIDIPAGGYARCQGQLSRAAWLRSWLGAQQPLFNWSDPWPALYDYRDLSARMLSLPLRRLVRRVRRGNQPCAS